MLHQLCPTPPSKESMVSWNVWLYLLRTHVFLLNHCPGTPSLKSLMASRPLAGLYEALCRRLASQRRTTLQVYVLFSSRGRKRGLLSGIGLLCVDLGLHGWGSLSAGVPTRLLLRQGGARRQREGPGLSSSCCSSPVNLREGPTAVSQLRREEESRGPKIHGESPSTSGVATARTQITRRGLCSRP